MIVLEGVLDCLIKVHRPALDHCSLEGRRAQLGAHGDLDALIEGAVCLVVVIDGCFDCL